MFLEVLVEVFEDHEKFRVGVDNVQEGNDVGVVKFFEERDLSDGCARNALVVSLKPNLLQRHCLENKLIQDNTYEVWLTNRAGFTFLHRFSKKLKLKAKNPQISR